MDPTGTSGGNYTMNRVRKILLVP